MPANDKQRESDDNAGNSNVKYCPVFETKLKKRQHSHYDYNTDYLEQKRDLIV